MQAQQMSTTASRNTYPASFSIPRVESTPVAEGPGLAHDAGNLLGALGLYCDLLDVPGVLRPEHRHYARELRLLSQRSSALIGRLLHGSPTENTAARQSDVCPAETLRAIAPLLRSLAAPDADVLIDAPSTMPALPFEVETFERILVNLTRNAATAMRSHEIGSEVSGEVRIQLFTEHRAGKERLCLVIADNGPGMPPKAAAAFMKPTPLPPGAMRGLGHRIVHELLNMTGGSLAIMVAVGRGTTLRLEWALPEASGEDGALAC